MEETAPPKPGKFPLQAHWILQLLLASAVSYTGQNEVWVRCAALAFLALWMLVETGYSWWHVNRSVTARLLSISIFSVLVLGGSGYLLYQIYQSDIAKRQADIKKNIVIAEENQDDPEDPFSASFSIANHSNYKIFQKVSCHLNRLVYPRDRSMNDSVITDEKAEPYGMAIEPDGSQTFKCAGDMPSYVLSMDPTSQIVCADMTISMSYIDEIEPTKWGTKEFRFYSKKGKGGYAWHVELNGLKRGGCG